MRRVAAETAGVTLLKAGAFVALPYGRAAVSAWRCP